MITTYSHWHITWLPLEKYSLLGALTPSNDLKMQPFVMHILCTCTMNDLKMHILLAFVSSDSCVYVPYFLEISLRQDLISRHSTMRQQFEGG